MSKRDIKLIFDDIIEASNRISAYIGQYSKEGFLGDQKTIDAVVRNVEIIGEADLKYHFKFAKNIRKFPGRKLSE
ncbi:hypothetical protein DSECCO2_136670 [anaerobic digester metagenome]